MAPTPAWMHVDLDVVGRLLEQRLAQRLDRTVHVGLEHDRQLLHAAALGPGEELVEGERRPRFGGLRALLRQPVVDDLLADSLALDHVDRLAGFGNARQPRHLHRNRGTGLLHPLAVLVFHRAHAAPVGADHDDVAALERAFLDEHGGDGPAPLVEARLQHDALGAQPTGRP